MTARETLEHLCEVYQATVTESKGEKHPWGTYSIEDKSWSNLSSTMDRMRAQAVSDVTASEDDAALKSAVQFIVLHDAYHVGQLSLIRLEAEPSWDPYSIYEH